MQLDLYRISRVAADKELTTLDIRIKGTPAHVTKLQELLSLIDLSCRIGASMQLNLHVDGDGNADITVARLEDGNEVDLYSEAEKDELDKLLGQDDIHTIGIGE